MAEAGRAVTFRVSAVIPAAGRGQRYGGDKPKQFQLLAGRPLLHHTLQPFLVHPAISEVVVVLPADYLSTDWSGLPNAAKIRVVAGGPRRQDSVRNGVHATAAATEIVLIHDAARPLVPPGLIDACLAACRRHDGAIAALPASDTVKEVEPGTELIRCTLPRERIWLAQTPQAFHKAKLLAALAAAENEDLEATDEAVLLERLGYSVAVVPGSPRNLKITTPEDWRYAKALLEEKHG